jgi:CheY-like chemotaxis protein
MKKVNSTILIADDNVDDQFLIVRAFKNIGVVDTIHVVGSGEEAIAYIRGEGKYADRTKFAYPTFIITDLKMPNGDGFDVLYQLKVHPEWRVIPTVVLSASSEPDDIKWAYLLGASSYLVKPHSMEILCQDLKILYAYWSICEVPDVDKQGKLVPTDGRGKLGARFHVVPGIAVTA